MTMTDCWKKKKRGGIILRFKMTRSGVAEPVGQDDAARLIEKMHNYSSREHAKKKKKKI